MDDERGWRRLTTEREGAGNIALGLLMALLVTWVVAAVLLGLCCSWRNRRERRKMQGAPDLLGQAATRESGSEVAEEVAPEEVVEVSEPWRGPAPQTDLVLIRDPRRARSRLPTKVAVRSGDSVFLKSRASGRYIDVQGEAVQATWAERAPLQELVLESSTASGGIMCGDTVHLKALSGRYLQVSDKGRVTASALGKGARSALIIQKAESRTTHDDIHLGDTIHFVATVGAGMKQIGVDHIEVHARWADQRGDEDMVIEADCAPAFERPRGARVLTESATGGEWRVSCLCLDADVGQLDPAVQLPGAGPCRLIESGSMGGPQQAFLRGSDAGAWRSPWQGKPSSEGRARGAFYLGVACETPLPVHTVRLVQADPERSAKTVLFQEQVAGGWWHTVLRHEARPACQMDTLLEAVGVIGFEADAEWDSACSAGFLGLDYDLSQTAAGSIALEAPCDPGRPRYFKNARAAIAAADFWERSDEFRDLDGRAAREFACNLRAVRQSDPENDVFAGFSSAWVAMMEVQLAKFRKGSPLAAALELTGDAFLLAHASAPPGEDSFWSDNGDGEGKNMLGLQLMLVRDRLFPSKGGAWTTFIEELYNTSTGMPRLLETRTNTWQDLVTDARDALLAQVFPADARPCRHETVKKKLQIDMEQIATTGRMGSPIGTPRTARSKQSSAELTQSACKGNKIPLTLVGGGRVVKV